MANCENCGAPLKPGARQCEFCGSEVNQNKNVNTDGINININTPNGAKSNININISSSVNNYVNSKNINSEPQENFDFDNEFFHNDDTPAYDAPKPEPSPQQEPSPQKETVPQPQYDFPISPKSKWLDFFLALFLGSLGIHKFYEGKIFSGILYLFTFGLFCIGWIADVILIPLNKATDKNGLPIVK